MTERYFPFTSVDDDRLYASADFRSFINSILGSGRCDYEEFDILAVDSLQCSIDSLELDTINISAGACIIKGAGYQSSAIEARKVNLPTGSDIYNGYVIARLDPNDSRRISTIISEQFIPDTDLILATVKANNTQIMELVNTENVVYQRYNLNPTQFETLITNLALNPDLVSQLAENPNLKNEIISELIPLIDSITTDIGDMNLNTTATDLTGAINETHDVPLDIQELYKPLIAPLSVSLTGFVEGSYLLYGEFYDDLRVFVKVSKTTGMSGTTALGTLPSGYRPTVSRELTAYDTDGNIIADVRVRIFSDGVVLVIGNVEANVIVMASYNSSNSQSGAITKNDIDRLVVGKSYTTNPEWPAYNISGYRYKLYADGFSEVWMYKTGIALTAAPAEHTYTFPTAVFNGNSPDNIQLEIWNLTNDARMPYVKVVARPANQIIVKTWISTNTDTGQLFIYASGIRGA